MAGASIPMTIRRHSTVFASSGKFLVFGGIHEKEDERGIRLQTPATMDKVFIYNAAVEAWETLKVNSKIIPPPTLDAPAVRMMNSSTLIFGGIQVKEDERIITNELWRLAIQDKDYTWERLDGTPTPSPRHGHVAWQKDDKMYVFSGIGPDPAMFIGEHCNVARYSQNRCMNNQLLQFVPMTNTWTAVHTTGDIPPPRKFPAADIQKNTVFVYGGQSSTGFFKLNLDRFNWTLLDDSSPPINLTTSLTVLDDDSLLLYGQAPGKAESTASVYSISGNKWRDLQTTVQSTERVTMSVLPGSVAVFEKRVSETAVAVVQTIPKSLKYRCLKVIHDNSVPQAEQLPKKLLKLIQF